MTFDWLHRRGGLPAATRSERRDAMYRAELAERAALLRRLGYPRERAHARLRANVRWDFELGAHGGGPSDADVEAIVAAAYGGKSSSAR